MYSLRSRAIIDGVEFNLRNERDISNGWASAGEPLLFGQDTLKDTKDPLSLVTVPLYSARDLLRMRFEEPDDLAEVGALARSLEV